MTRTKDIQALLKRAERDLDSIEKEYSKSLQDQEISSDLKIDIKDLFGHLRSVLDYLACDIREKYCPTAKPDVFYFPIIYTPKSFTNMIKAKYPGLDKTCPYIWHYFEKIQPYQPDFVWLGQFNKINNENKHNALVEQKRVQKEQILVTGHGKRTTSYNPNSVFIGKNVFINGVPVDVTTQKPFPHPNQIVKHIIWIDFCFEGISVSALGLMKQSLAGIKSIVSEIQKWI